MTAPLQRALRDIGENRFLNLVTVVTIALSVLIVGSFALFFINGQALFDAWKQGLRMMVYLEPDTDETQRADVRLRLEAIAGIRSVRFVSKEKALAMMRKRLERQRSLLENLAENPLPDAFEVMLTTENNTPDKVALLAQRIEQLAAVAEVEYGRQWLERFANLFNLFKVAGTGVGVLFFAAAVLITANTIRLVLYARREEIRVMRLVGATDSFIRLPFYLVGLIQGFLGSCIGIGVLYAAAYAVGTRFEQTLAAEMIGVRFFSPFGCVAIVVGGMLTGLLGCAVSLRQFLGKHEWQTTA